MTTDELTKKRDTLNRLLENGLERKLFGYLKNCGISGQNAKDPVQAVLLWCLTSAEDLNKIKNPVSYIGVRACWRARDQSRQKWRATPLDGTPEPTVEPVMLATDFDRTPLSHALNQLSEEDRWLIEKRYFEDADYCELAEALGKTCDCLQTRVRRILKRMRAFLEGPGCLPTASDDGDRLALIDRKTVQPDVGRRSRQKSSTMSVRVA